MFCFIGLAGQGVNLGQRQSGVNVDHVITAPLCESGSAISRGAGLG
jgi:hypothetical protein